jgi:hypothetical protein
MATNNPHTAFFHALARTEVTLQRPGFQWLVGIGLFIITQFSASSVAAPLDDWFSPPTVGASALCGVEGATSGITAADNRATSCRLPGEAVGSADLPNASVKVYAASSQWGDPEGFSTGSTTAFMDLITITDGWDANGEASGTFELVVNGTMDDSNPEYSSQADFEINIWKNPCYSLLDSSCKTESDDDYYDNGTSVTFRLLNGSIDAQKYERGTGRAVIQSDLTSDLRASLAVRWSATRAKPSFYIMAYAQGGMWGATAGKVDFFDSGQAHLSGPEGLQYTSTNGYGSRMDSQPPPEGAADLGGAVHTAQGLDICALVLASGEYVFSCGPHGAYSLNELPRDPDGTVTRQVYADGFFPLVEKLAGSVVESVVLQPAQNCPNYNQPSSPGTYPGSAGRRITISGRVLLQNSDTPICALVLANGSHMFSCDGTGQFDLELPLDENGQYSLQVYADGFAPAIQTFDEFSIPPEVRMAPAAQCL